MTILQIFSVAILLTFFLPSLSDKIILLGFIIFPVVNTFTPKFSLYRKNKNKSDLHNFSWCDHVYIRSPQFSGKYPKTDQISRPKKIFLATETIFITSPRKHVNNNCVTIFSAVRNLNNPLVLDSKKIVNFYVNER